MDYKFLKIDNSHVGICILAISAPQSLNALSAAVLDELDHFVSNIDRRLRVLVITGDGSKAFVAGADIAEMSHLNATEALAFSQKGAAVFAKIEDLEMPVIAAVNGFALGGGCELALACDIRIAAENAVFGQPEVKLGILPGFSGTYRLSKLIGQGMAKEMIYTGRTIRSEEALRIGLVNAVVKPEELMSRVFKTASFILHNAPIAVRKAKQCINQNYDMNRTDALALENKCFSECFATHDQKEGMHAFLEKRDADFQDK